jgi:hypothetical protein
MKRRINVKDKKMKLLAMVEMLIKELREQGYNIDPEGETEHMKSWPCISEFENNFNIGSNSMDTIRTLKSTYQQNVEKFKEETK